MDFCIRVAYNSFNVDPNKEDLRTLIVAVPGAKAVHPWWGGGSPFVIWMQMIGWARGDSLCVSVFPTFTYFTMPNWIEALVGWGLISICFRSVAPLVLIVILVFVTDLGWNVRALYHQSPHPKPSLDICICAALIRQAQQTVRLLMHICRGSPNNICFRMDFFLGAEPNFRNSDRMDHLARFSMFACIIYFAEMFFTCNDFLV